MKKIIVSLIITVLVIAVIGCGGGGRKTVTKEEAPEWYLNPPKDPDYLFGVNTSTSLKMQIAVDKAKAGARKDIADQLEVKVQGLVKKFEEEVGSGKDAELNTFYNQTMKAVTSQTLNGSRVGKQEIMPQKDNLYRAYVLMELPLNEFNANIVKSVKKNKKLYDRFRASQAFEEMEQDVKEFEEFKKEEGNY